MESQLLSWHQKSHSPFMSLQGKNKRTTDTCDWDTQNVEAPVEQNPQIQASSSEQLSMFVELDTLKSMRAKQDRNAADEVQESTCFPHSQHRGFYFLAV